MISFFSASEIGLKVKISYVTDLAMQPLPAQSENITKHNILKVNHDSITYNTLQVSNRLGRHLQI